MSDFLTPVAEFTYVKTYARYREDLGRRETWPETVERYIGFISEELGNKIPPKVIKKIREYVTNFDVMPSMRLIWSAGDAAKATNVAAFNCAFLAMDSIISFAELLYILCCGTGVGFSVERKYVEKLPEIQAITSGRNIIYKVDDSKEGWADSVKFLVKSLYDGFDIDFDYGLIRPKGAKLKTMGGRASGPAPLINLHEFIRNTFANAQGRKLSSLEVHDICTKIGEVVVVGGVRRTAEISLSDLDDKEMRDAKTGTYPLHREMANNSAVYNSKPTAVEFLNEWGALASSGRGERGIFNLVSVRERDSNRRNRELIAGVNPCGEILLRNNQFCNLSSVIIRPNDDLDSLLEKMECATWIGCIQSCFTNFPYLNKKWKKNCEEERLLGVSLSGQLDNPSLLTPDILKALRNRALRVAKKAANILEINMPTAITCVKPDGNTSQLCDTAPGLHPRFSRYYIRRQRINDTDPLFKMLKDQGFKMTPENGQTEKNATTWVMSFPVKAPSHAVLKDNFSALDQLEWYKKLMDTYCEHNASSTVYAKDSDWFNVGNWVYENWGIVNGLSFLPANGGHYEQAPYEEITKERIG